MNNYKRHLTFDNLSIFLLSIYPLMLILGSFVSELLNFFIILTFILYVSKNDIIKIINNKIFIYCLIIWLFFIINLLFFSNYFYVSLPRAIFFARFILLFISVVYLLNKIKNKLSYVVFFWLVFFTFIYIDLIIQYFYNKNLFNQTSPWPGRLSGIMGLKLNISALILGFIPLIVGFFYQKKNFFYHLVLFS